MSAGKQPVSSRIRSIARRYAQHDRGLCNELAGIADELDSVVVGEIDWPMLPPRAKTRHVMTGEVTEHGHTDKAVRDYAVASVALLVSRIAKL